MELIKSSNYIDIEFDKANRLFRLVWKPESESMTNEIFRQEMLEYRDLFDMGIWYILQQMRDMRFPIEPEMQTWLNTEINPVAIQKGIKKMAIVMSTELFASISVEQGLADFNPDTDALGYFDNEDQALKWLLN